MRLFNKLTGVEPTVYRDGGTSDFFEKTGDVLGTAIDPGGLYYQAEGGELSKFQQKVDIGGYGARPAAAAKTVEKEAKKQQAKISTQEAEIEKKRKTQQTVIDERSARMLKNQLLSGSETGTSGTISLLQG